MLSCSIIIPCYNEADNILECISRVPRIGSSIEIIVVDDGSTDNTKQIVESVSRYDNRVRLISYMQNKGKGYAVKIGCNTAQGDVIIILDADMSVMPEDLPKFFNPIQEGKTDFVNGTRMIYPITNQSMKILHYLGNKLSSIIVSWIIEQRISDTLCGTKAFLRKDYIKITMGRCMWGDFDLLFGIARLRKKIMEAPIHYKKRRGGKSKMDIRKYLLSFIKMYWVGIYELRLFK